MPDLVIAKFPAGKARSSHEATGQLIRFERTPRRLAADYYSGISRGVSRQQLHQLLTQREVPHGA